MTNDHEDPGLQPILDGPDKEDLSAPNKIFTEPRPEILSDEIDEADFSDGVEHVLQENTGVLDSNFQAVRSKDLYTNTWYYPMIVKRDQDGLWRRRYIYHKSMSFGYKNFKRDNNDDRKSQYYRMMFVKQGDFDANIKTRQHVIPGQQYQLVSERNAYANTKLAMEAQWAAELIAYIINSLFFKQIEYKYTMNPKGENTVGDLYTVKVGNHNAAWIPEVGDFKFMWTGYNWVNGMRLKSAHPGVDGYLNTQHNGDDIFVKPGKTENYIVFCDHKIASRDFYISSK
ncbi:hypothetical protein BGZ83_006022 [Gryganskiella cystojenkinii]|nr:hypothetical protein BGZ83_006022 [Gryganskiella cystojenkinii]